ncbi:MAG TPA: hypothetical protein VK324_11135 [Tepidisphaeraceae bacterium]|nr:hypothetical protein [Tepidisphaeraceae bacterium]
MRTRHRARRVVVLPRACGRRWHAESFFSGMKRVCGSAVRARSVPAMLSEAMLKLLAYAVRR